MENYKAINSAGASKSGSFEITEDRFTFSIHFQEFGKRLKLDSIVYIWTAKEAPSLSRLGGIYSISSYVGLLSADVLG